MTMNRRTFVGSMMAAGAAAHLAGCNGEKKREGQSEYSVRFDITGLFAFKYWQKSKKQVEALLVNGPIALGNAAAIHAAQLIARWEDFDDTRVGGGSYYTPPQPVEVGGQTFAVWSLVNRILWIGGVHKDDKYDDDPASNLKFKTDTYGQQPPPETPGSEAEWQDLHWFADLTKVLKKNPPIEIKKEAAIRRSCC